MSYGIIEDLPQKQCTKCKKVLPGTPDFFYRKKQRLQPMCKACCADWRREHRECFRLGSARYNAKNRAKVNARQREKHAANSERYAAANRAWRAKNPEKVIAYRRTHREQHKEINARRRARISGAAIRDFTVAQWNQMQELYNHRCAYCGKRCNGKLTKDHITPLSKGGNHTYSNIVPACRACNSKKHAGPVLTPIQPLLILS